LHIQEHLAMLAETLHPLIRKEGTLLLEKK
jgi:hypothetical protein